jgi:hypothetical protein
MTDTLVPVSDPAPTIGGWPSDRPFPVVLTPTDLRQVFQISAAVYYRQKALGKFKRFELVPNVVDVPRYLGALVQAYVQQQGPARVFGGKRGPRVA